MMDYIVKTNKDVTFVKYFNQRDSAVLWIVGQLLAAGIGNNEIRINVNGPEAGVSVSSYDFDDTVYSVGLKPPPVVKEKRGRKQRPLPMPTKPRYSLPAKVDADENT